MCLKRFSLIAVVYCRIVDTFADFEDVSLPLVLYFGFSEKKHISSTNFFPRIGSTAAHIEQNKL